MAQSMYEIIETGKIEVNHNGEDVTFSIPLWMQRAAGKLENEQDLLEWAREEGIIHALLHAGISDTIIGLRAVIRPAAKKNAQGNLVQVSLSADVENAQKRKDAFKIKAKTRPGTGGAGVAGVKNKAEIDTLTKVCKAMREAGLTDEVIHSMQDPVFGKVKVSLALNSIED